MPIHRYNAIEITADKRFANHWALQSSYRYARLRGTYEGFFRDDNGQSDPGITSLFDFPTNDPSYTTIGVPQFGYSGDVRFLGGLGAGPLPLDRPHQFKAFGNYSFDMGLNLGLGLLITSGKPLTSLAANPVYDSPGEIPLTARGAGFETVDRIPDADAGRVRHQHPRRLPFEALRSPAHRRARGCLQPVQPTDRARLRSEHRDDLSCAEPGLR